MGEADDPDPSNSIRTWARKTPGRTPIGASLPPYDHATSHDTEKPQTTHGPHHAPKVSHGVGQQEQRIVHTADHHNIADAGTHHVEKSAAGARSPSESASAGTPNATLTAGDDKKQKPPLPQRLKAGSVRFLNHGYRALTHSWINILLVFVPIGIAVRATHQSPTIIFAINAVAIIPLAGLLVYATESVASRLGNSIGALLNVSFGNAVELIIYIIALTKNEIRIVQASLIGSILGNLLLILGMAFVWGGLRYQEQIYNNTVTQMSACLLSLSVISLLLPTAFHASWRDTDQADVSTLKISRATSIILLVLYVLVILFQVKSHAHLYQSMPQHIIDEESHPGFLANVMDSSSSSSDSSSSSSSDSDTSGSVTTTTKRIKRAFRHRRRRKSSASSINTTSAPSVLSSPSFDRSASIAEPSAVPLSAVSRRASNMTGMMSGDEADHEHAAGAPRVRDFVEHLHEEIAKDRARKKARKHHKKNKKHRGDETIPEQGPSASTSMSSQGKKPSIDPPTATSEIGHGTVGPADPAMRKAFGLRPFQTQSAPMARSALPRMFSQNVFTTTPSMTEKPLPAGPAMVKANALRRTNSLPGKLDQAPAPAPAETPHPLMYPYTHPVGHIFEKPGPEVAEAEQPAMSRTAAAVLLLISTGLVAICAEFLVGAIPEMLEANTSISPEFVGLIILPIVSNAAEHFTAVIVAGKNKMDLAMGVSLGSSIQIALFVTPVIVLLGWALDKDMPLFFNLFETVCIFVTAFVVNFLVLDGRSNYLEGCLLLAAYAIIGVCAFFFPQGDQLSSISGGGD